MLFPSPPPVFTKLHLLLISLSTPLLWHCPTLRKMCPPPRTKGLFSHGCQTLLLSATYAIESISLSMCAQRLVFYSMGVLKGLVG